MPPLSPEELAPLLSELLPSWQTHYPCDQLEAIARQCNVWWQKYVDKHFGRGQPVKLLLICEAPPWRAPSKNLDDDDLYIYQPNDGGYKGNLIGAAVKGVAMSLGILEAPTTPTQTKNNAESKAKALDFLGEHGVLLVDPLPVALPYSGKGSDVPHSALRDKQAYSKLAAKGWAACLKDLEGLTFSADLRVAFSLRKTMRALLGGKRGELKLPGGHKAAFDEDTHCIASGAGQPDAKQLRDLLLRVDEPKTERKGAPASRKRGRAGQ